MCRKIWCLVVVVLNMNISIFSMMQPGILDEESSSTPPAQVYTQSNSSPELVVLDMPEDDTPIDEQPFIADTWQDTFKQMSENLLFKKYKIWLYRITVPVGMVSAGLVYQFTSHHELALMLGLIPCAALIPDILAASISNGELKGRKLAFNILPCCKCNNGFINRLCFNTCCNRICLDSCCEDQDGDLHV